jgi:hypothetical protein
VQQPAYASATGLGEAVWLEGAAVVVVVGYDALAAFERITAEGAGVPLLFETSLELLLGDPEPLELVRPVPALPGLGSSLSRTPTRRVVFRGRLSTCCLRALGVMCLPGWFGFLPHVSLAIFIQYPQTASVLASVGTASPAALCWPELWGLRAQYAC